MDNNTYNVVGTMSGTSLDGLDMVLAEFQPDGSLWNYAIKKSKTVPYPSVLKRRLSNIMHESALSFVKLDRDLGKFIGDEINLFLEDINEKPLFIASHGHTIFHQPKEGFTTQIGSGAVIAARTGFRTIADFRSLDVALGGEGAPLVPIGDELLFSSMDFCLNLGGFCNISFRRNGIRHAFDIAPCNMILNFLATEKNADFDKNGDWARKGEIDFTLLEKLNNLSFYHLGNVSKSLGKEWFDEIFLPIVAVYSISVEDKLRTAVEHIAEQIAIVVNREKGEQMLITGGGAFNIFLVEEIQKKCFPQIILPDVETINYKEALIFAFLGLLRWRGEINVLHQVTGAIRNSSSGAIY